MNSLFGHLVYKRSHRHRIVVWTCRRNRGGIDSTPPTATDCTHEARTATGHDRHTTSCHAGAHDTSHTHRERETCSLYAERATRTTVLLRQSSVRLSPSPTPRTPERHAAVSAPHASCSLIWSTPWSDPHRARCPPADPALGTAFRGSARARTSEHSSARDAPRLPAIAGAALGGGCSGAGRVPYLIPGCDAWSAPSHARRPHAPSRARRRHWSRWRAVLRTVRRHPGRHRVRHR